jgi:lipopolysaccharide export system permease protein
LRQIIATLVMTVAVFTFVLLLGNVLREILPLLISQRATFGLTAQAFGLLIPFVWVFALPMGMLTATLLVFGRFSADQELTATRASGVSLVSLTSPILIFSLLLSAVSAAVNLEIAPRCRVAYNDLREDMKAALANVKLPAGRFLHFPGEQAYMVYVGKNRNQKLEDVLLYRLQNETNVVETIRAARGEIQSSSTNGVILRLYDVKGLSLASDLPASASHISIPLSLAAAEKRSKPRLSDMTFSELRQELHRLEQQLHIPAPVASPGGEEGGGKPRKAKQTKEDLLEPIRVQIHYRLAFSFACFGFTLIGIPLGIRVHRRETNVGIAIALLLVAVYYGMMVAAESLDTRPEFAPHLLMWLPNFVFQAVGAVLLWRVNRGI